jgi:hypothetical protein
VNLSRVTWLVLGTTMVLVSAVLLAAVIFINGTSQRFPRGAATGGSGVARVGPARAKAAEHIKAPERLAAVTIAGRRRAAAHPTVTGLTPPLGPAGAGPTGPSNPGGPPGQQYDTSLQQLNAKLRGR